MLFSKKLSNDKKSVVQQSTRFFGAAVYLFKINKCKINLTFNVHGSMHRNNILVYNSNQMHKSQSLFYLTTALHISGVTITHFQ